MNKNNVVMWALIDTNGNICKESGLYESKKSLLISHDLISLHGLELAEKRLCEKGKIPKKVEVCTTSNNPNHYYVPIVKNIPDIKMIDYGCYGKDKSKVVNGIALYLSDDYKGRGVDRFDITKDEQNLFNSFVFFDVIKVKRCTRKKALDMITSKMDVILQQNKIVVSIVDLKMEDDLKAEMEAKAKRGELEGISKYAIFDKNGKLVLDMD